MIVGQKIEIKANNKFYTYCRKAFGVYRLAYNYCVERFINIPRTLSNFTRGHRLVSDLPK